MNPMTHMAKTLRIQELEDAILNVVSQKADNLCWRDVYTQLANLLPDHKKVTVDSTPPTDIFLGNCMKFEQSMRRADKRYLSPEQRREKLRLEITPG